MPGHRLRAYQLGPARAIAESIDQGLGRQFAVVFSRQAGKDEMLAQLLAYLLVRRQFAGGQIAVAAPTFRPQAALSRDRLLTRLAASPLGGRPRVRDGYAVTLGRASARFLSAAPGANARGQTADLLLVANEAQDIAPDVWDAVFDPMAASTNATTLFMGTVWSRETLLARQMRHLEALSAEDGVQRVWRVDWQEVARELPAYGERVRARMAQFGAAHPFIRTEYCLEEISEEGGLFPEQRLALLRGDHPRRHRAEPGRRYALLIDVAGEEEAGAGPVAFASAGRRDSTALTVVEIVVRSDGPPRFRVVDRMAWTGVKQHALHDQIVHLAREVWRAEAVVIDATGVGAGLASFLAASLEGRGGRRVRVIPFVFTQASKSELGWALLGLIDAGRLADYADDSDLPTPEGRLTARFWAEMRATEFTVLPGPGRLLRWGVPAGRGHDDLVTSLALVSALDGLDWRRRVATGNGEDNGDG